MPTAFHIDKYLEHSRRVDTAGLPAGGGPLTADEVRCLTYFADVESHTILFLKGILSTCAIRDEETKAFLSCWAYEEFFHGHALSEFLDQSGAPRSAEHIATLARRGSWREWLEGKGAALLCRMTPHFHAVYLTWGAISELTTLEGYGVLANSTGNPALAELLRRIAKQERRHFAFYYNKAREALQHPRAQRLTRWILARFWLPVGAGIEPDSEVRWIAERILNGAGGARVAARIDHTIAKLPGMEWFRGLSELRSDALRLNRAGAGAGVASLSLQS
jgi:rubrerythrin